MKSFFFFCKETKSKGNSITVFIEKYLWTHAIETRIIQGSTIVEIPWYADFSDWLLSLHNMHVRFLHVSSWLGSSFLSCAEKCFVVWMDHSLFTHSPTKGLSFACFGNYEESCNEPFMCRCKFSAHLGKHLGT